MYYKPHKIQVKVRREPSYDEKGHPIFAESEWEDSGVGRCDENSIQEMRDDNGLVYRPSYHIVIEGATSINVGDEIRCLRSDGTVRGEGKVKNVKNLNYLKYSEIWV